MSFVAQAVLAALALLAMVLCASQLGRGPVVLQRHGPLLGADRQTPAPTTPAPTEAPLPVLGPFGPDDLWASAQSIASEMARPKSPGEKHHIEEVVPSVSVVEADIGRYNGCDRGGTVPVFHMVLIGHLRTFSHHSANLHSFLTRSNSCWLLSLFVHDEIDKKFDPKTADWSPNTERVVANLKQRGETVRSLIIKGREALGGSNVAYMIAKFGSWVPNVRGGIAWSSEVARRHGLKVSDRDVIAVSRTDIVFSHAVDFPRLQAAARKVAFVLLPHHEAAYIGGADPSEMLVVGVRRYWEGMCLHRQRPRQRANVTAEPGQQLAPFAGAGCLAPAFSCGYFAPYLLHFAGSAGVQAFFYNTGLKLLLHRLTGDWSRSVMRPGRGSLRSPNDQVPERPLDITQSATCALMARASCGKEGPQVSPPKSRCWGETRHTKIQPGHSGLWTCRHKGSVDQCGAAFL